MCKVFRAYSRLWQVLLFSECFMCKALPINKSRTIFYPVERVRSWCSLYIYIFC